MKILCIGEALIDMICLDTGKPLSEGSQFVAKPGGAPTNVAAAIGALGGQVELVAKVGDDAFGRKLISTLHQFGVSTQWMIQSPAHFTTMAFVSLMENGERDFIFNRGADGALDPDEVARIDLDTVSIIHFGSATAFLPGPLQSAYQSLLQKALQKKIFISFDPNYRHLLFTNNVESFITQSWQFLKACHFCKLSDEEAMLITGQATLAAAANVLSEKTKSVFAITTGKEGALLGYNRLHTIVPGFKINPVDTTGAGDAFAGAVLYQLSVKPDTLLHTFSMEEWITIISNANRVAARTCAFVGAMEAFRHLQGDILKR
jgi:fructokinase